MKAIVQIVPARAACGDDGDPDWIGPEIVPRETRRRFRLSPSEALALFGGAELELVGEGENARLVVVSREARQAA